MPLSEFSEDQYEQNLMVELRDVFGVRFPHFKPSRNLEKNLGYDFAVATDYASLRARGVFTNDTRLPGLNAIQRNALISNTYVTSFIQTKRPMYVSRRHASTVEQFDHWGTPYYRFEIESDQNQKLAETERAMGGEAIVRYASPCFWQRQDSDVFMMTRQVTQRSHFVSPSRLQNHDDYTYVSPMRPGRAFSEPEDIEVEPFLFRIRLNLAQNQQKPLAAHYLKLWTAFREDRRYFELDAHIDSFLRIAARIAGEDGDLPLDPFGLSSDGLRGNWPDDRDFPTVFSFVSTIVAVELLARDVLGCSTLTFTR